MKKRILFLMSDTGGGHRASARAIAEAVHHLYLGKFETIIEDIWQNYTSWPLNVIPRLYPWLTGPGLPLYRRIWSTYKCPRLVEALLCAANPFVRKHMVDYIREVQPDLVVSVHPAMNHLGVRWLRSAGLPHTPFITVVTDMVSIHPAWICPEVTACIVPTDLAYEHAIAYGMPAQKLLVRGQPASLKFAAHEKDKRRVRCQLGLEPDCSTVLIVGGGQGLGRIFVTARTLAQTVPQIQLIVVAGRNETLKEKLTAVTWEIPTRVFGFVDNMPELMAASDILITKAGPGTISEAFIAGMPTILNGYIPGQETGNVTYVTQNKAGTFAESPHSIAQTVREWLTPDSPVLPELIYNASRLARPDASLAIASDLYRLM